jgi:hypothetical protein
MGIGINPTRTGVEKIFIQVLFKIILNSATCNVCKNPRELCINGVPDQLNEIGIILLLKLKIRFRAEFFDLGLWSGQLIETRFDS